MPSASSSATGGAATKSGKQQGSKPKTNNNKRPNPTGPTPTANKLPTEDGTTIPTEESTKITNTNAKNDHTISTKSSSGSKAANNTLPKVVEQLHRGSAEATLEHEMTTLLEHKIRNLDKRKTKLDSYKAEQAKGKILNADQLQAVSKYSDVQSQLDFAKDLEKSFKEIIDNYLKALKKQQGQDSVERYTANLEKTKLVLTLVSLLREFTSEETRRDFKEGTNGALKLSEDQLSCLTDLQSSTVEANLFEDKKLASAAESLVNIMDEQQRIISGNITFKDVKSLLLDLSSSEYFKPANIVERARVNKDKQEKEKALSDAQNVRALEEPVADTKEKMPTQGNFTFTSDSQMDLPHMDPAVLAVSYTTPPVSHDNSRFNQGIRNDQQQVQPMMMPPHDGVTGDVNLNNLSLKSGTMENWQNPSDTNAKTEWSTGRDGTINVGLNESEGVDFDFQRREGDRLQYQNRRQPSNPLNNGYRGSPNQYQKTGGNLNGKSNDSAYDGRDRFDRSDNVYDCEKILAPDSSKSSELSHSNVPKPGEALTILATKLVCQRVVHHSVLFPPERNMAPSSNAFNPNAATWENEVITYPKYAVSDFEDFYKLYKAYIGNWKSVHGDPNAELVPYIGGPYWPRDLPKQTKPFLVVPANLTIIRFEAYPFPRYAPYLCIPTGFSEKIPRKFMNKDPNDRLVQIWEQEEESDSDLEDAMNLMANQRRQSPAKKTVTFMDQQFPFPHMPPMVIPSAPGYFGTANTSLPQAGGNHMPISNPMNAQGVGKPYEWPNKIWESGNVQTVDFGLGSAVPQNPQTVDFGPGSAVPQNAQAVDFGFGAAVPQNAQAVDFGFGAAVPQNAQAVGFGFGSAVPQNAQAVGFEFGSAVPQNAQAVGFGFGSAVPQNAQAVGFGFGSAVPQNPQTVDFGFGSAVPQNAQAVGFGFGSAVPQNAQAIGFGFGSAVPQNAQAIGFGFGSAVPQNAQAIGFGFGAAVPQNAQVVDFGFGAAVPQNAQAADLGVPQQEWRPVQTGSLSENGDSDHSLSDKSSPMKMAKSSWSDSNVVRPAATPAAPAQSASEQCLYSSVASGGFRGQADRGRERRPVGFGNRNVDGRPNEAAFMNQPNQRYPPNVQGPRGDVGRGLGQGQGGGGGRGGNSFRGNGGGMFQ